MNRRLIALASLALSATLVACGAQALAGGDEAGGVEGAAGREQALGGMASLTAPISPAPATAGAGLAMKAVCIGNTGAGGTCTVPGGNSLNTVALAVAALNKPAPTNVPATAAQVISFVPATQVDWTDAQGGANGIFSVDNDLRGLFGAETYQIPYSYAGYVLIPASATATTKSFAVGSDDGFAMLISNGTQIFKYANDGPRGFATGGTPSAINGAAPPAGSTLQVTFPINANAALYPIELVFYEQLGQEGVELSWADGAKATAPLSGALNGFALIPTANLYAPDIRASLYATNTDAAAGPVAAGTHLTYTTQISNRGSIPSGALTYTVVFPTTLNYVANTSGCTSTATGGITTLTCSIAAIAAGGTTTITFTTTVANGVASGGDAGTSILDLQGVVSGAATSTDLTAQMGDTAQIYVLTDDPGAPAPLSTTDTGNSPASFAGTPGLVDDDATRVTAGAALVQPPVVNAPASPASSLVRIVVSGTSTFTAGQLVQVTVTGGPNNSITKTCTATVTSGGAWACPSATYPDGTYMAVAAVANVAGQTGQPSAPYTFVVSPPPAPVLTTPANGAVVRNSQVFLAGTSSAPPGTSVLVTVTDSTNTQRTCTAAVQSDGSWVCAETLPDGGYSWTAAIPELAGAIGPSAAAQTFTVNSSGLPAPTIAQTSPSPTPQRQPMLSGTVNASDAGAGYKLVVYDGNTAVCTIPSVATTWSCTPSALADGSHVLTAVIFDSAGNSSPASNPDAFLVDATAPAAPTLAQVPTPGAATRPVISGTGEAGDTVTVTSSAPGTATICTAVVSSNGSWSCQPASNLSNTTYTVSAKQTDAAGNVSPASPSMTFSVDNVAPGQPTLAQPTSPTQTNTPTLMGTAEAGSTITVRDQTGRIVCTVATVPANGNWSCTSAALPDGTNTLTATATDSAGNATASNPVKVLVDTIAPAAPVLAQNDTPTANTTPTFRGTGESGATVTVTVTGGSFNGAVVCTTTVVNGAFSCGSTVSLPGAPQAYVATATEKDSAGNVSPASNNDSFTVDTRVPVAPAINPLPTLPGGNPNTTDQPQPKFTGTGTPGDLVSVEVQPGGAILCSAIVQADGTWSCVTQASAAINGNPATQVTVAAVQESPAGVFGANSPQYTFTVATANSATPTLSGTAAAGSVLTVRDESGRVICVVNPVPATGSWSCTPQVPLHEGQNTLSATSVGPSGLTSAPSTTVTTKVDTLAPLPPAIAQTPSPTANTTPTFTGTAEAGSTVKIYDGANPTPIATCTAASDGTYSCATNAATPLTGSPSTHSVQATATDAAGNVSQLSNLDSFVVDTTKPGAPTLNPLPTPTGATAGNTNVTQPTFTGTGTPGDTVTVSSTSPSAQTLCTAVVKNDGTYSCQSTQTLSGDPATQYTFTASQTTPAGVPGAPSAPISETISTATPNTPTLTVPAHPVNTQDVPLSGTGTPGDTIAVLDPTGQIVCTAAVKADGTWTCTTTALPEGTTKLTAVDVSKSGVPSAPSAPGSVTVITYGPLAPTLAQTASPTNNSKPTFTGKAQPGSSVTVTEGSLVLCTTTADANGDYSCASGTVLADGLNQVTATATDSAGNVSATSNTDSFIVDTSTPAAPVISVSPAQNGGKPGVTTNPYPVISGTGTAGDTVTVTSNGTTLCTALVTTAGTWSCTSTVSLPGNPATPYPLSATQTSPAGNTSGPGTGMIIVDTTATAVPTLDQPTSPTRDRQPALTGTGVPGDTIQVYSGATVLCTATVTPAGSWTCSPSTPLADGSYLLVAVQTGPAGTTSGSSTTRDLVVNGSSLPAPTFDQPTSPTANNEPTLSGTAEAGATVTVTDSTTGALICTAIANNAGIWTCRPTAPLSSGPHTFTATATDALGNTSPASAPRTVVVTSPGGAPDVAITAPADASQLTTSRPQITGTSTPGSTVAVTIDGVTYQAQTSADGTWVFTPTADLGAGTHTVTAMSTNSLGMHSPVATSSFLVYATYLARGGCASGGVPSPVLALLALMALIRFRRRSTAAPVSLLQGMKTAALAAIVGIATISPAARAQSSFNLETFRPAAGGDGYVGVEGARPPNDDDKVGKIDVKLWLDGTNKPLTVILTDGSKHALVRQRYDGWLSAQFHLNGPLSLSAQIPMLFAQHGDLSYLPPAARGPSSFGASIGDVRITPRLSIFRQENVGIDLAAQASIELPTGQTDSLSSDGRVNGEFLGSIGHRIYLAGPDSVEILGNIYARLRPPREILDVKVGSTAGLRAAIGYYFGADKGIVPQRVFGELDAQSYLRAGFTSGSAPAEWRVGATWCVTRLGFTIDAAVGTGIGNGVGAPSARGLIGLGYSPGSCRLTDRDGDGVPDRDDKCVNTPGVPEQQGCPALADRDHDGVPDTEDACPDEAGLKENRGCPANHDRDGDGVPDVIDRCPEVPGPQSNSGCPEVQKPLVCAPTEPIKQAELPLAPLVEAPVLLPTPPPPDRDHDGVPDDIDNCPDEAGPADNHGCPAAQKQLVVINGAKIDILEKVFFATNKSVIDPRSFILLNQVAQVLNGHPDLVKIEVQGHTDNVGDAKKNLRLSQDRAEAVVQYLVAKKVKFDRLKGKGYGSTQPVVPNTSKASREKNRRVEFHVLETKAHSIEAEVKPAAP
jgi:outer membrane protein OmpA-like peptidoglycan-associated protein